MTMDYGGRKGKKKKWKRDKWQEDILICEKNNKNK